MDEKDFRTYLSFVAEYQIKHSFHLCACALMKSHIPLMAVEATPLSKVYGWAIVGYLARKLTGSLVKDIARHFQSEPMMISGALMKMESLVEKNMELTRRIEYMRSNLMKRGKKKYLITVA